MKKTKISISGHANVGKTTLVRNISRKKIGNVGDIANLTKKAETIEHHDVFAEFIDCPGFQEAGRILDLLDSTPNFDMLKSKLEQKDLIEDFEAISAIKSSDIVYYVVSLDTVPDKGYISEIKLIKRLCPNIIGIINRKKTNLNEDRLTQWESFFSDNNIDWIQYNLHWGSPRILNSLFSKSTEYLDKEKAESFKKSLEEYKNKLLNDNEKVCDSIIELIKKCKEIRHESVAENSSEYTTKINELKKKITNETLPFFRNYTENLKNIYNLNYDELSDKQFTVSNIDRIIQSSFSKGIDNIVKSTALGAGAGGLLGAYGVAKAVTLTLTFTPIGPAVVAGLAIGSVIGLLFGVSSAASTESTKKIVLQFTDDNLTTLSILAIAIAWCSAYQGYGLSDIVSLDRVEQLISDDILPISKKIDFKVDSEKDIDYKDFRKKINIIFQEIRL